MSTKPAQLHIKDPAEDVPRLVAGAGKACGGEWAMVLLPHERAGVLAHAVGKTGRLWSQDGVGDAPTTPDGEHPTKALIGKVEALRRKMPAQPTPISLNGRWAGTMTCDDGRPEITLKRAVATYADLTITNQGGLWKWALSRKRVWFADETEHQGSAGSLATAIMEAIQALNGVLGAACAVRDSRRRGALDAAWGGTQRGKQAVPWGKSAGKDPETWAPSERAPRGSKAQRGAPTGEAPTGDEVMPAGEFTHWMHDDEFPETTDIKPSAALVKALKKLGLSYDSGAGSYLGITTEEWEGYPMGSLVFRNAEDGDGFYIAKGQPAPGSRFAREQQEEEAASARRASANAKAIAAQAKAAVDALNAAPETAKPSDQQERTTAAHLEIAADGLAQSPVHFGPHEQFWATIDLGQSKKLNATIDMLLTNHRDEWKKAGQAAAIWRDGTPPDGKPPHGWPDGRRDWATMPLDQLREKMIGFTSKYNADDYDISGLKLGDLVKDVYRALLEVTPPFGAAYQLIAGARKHIAEPRCKDPERAEARRVLVEAVNELEGITHRRRHGLIPADQLAAMRGRAREITVAAAKLARACGKGQRSLGLGAAPAAAPAPAAPAAPAAALPMPTTWAGLQPWLVEQYRAAGVNHARVDWMASEVAGLLYRGEFGDLIDPNTNKVGAGLVAKLMGVKPFKTAKAMKEFFIGVPAIKLTGRLPGTEEPRAAQGEDDVRASVEARYPDLPYTTRAKLRWLVLEAAATLEKSEDEQYIDTGDATELLNKVRDLLPEGDWLRGQIDLLNQQSEENEETDSDDVVTLLNEVVRLGEAPPVKPALVREPQATAKPSNTWSPVSVVHVRDEPAAGPFKVGDRVSFMENGRKVVGEVVREGGGGLVAVMPDGAMVAALKRPEGLTMEGPDKPAARATPPTATRGEPRPTRGDRAGANDDKIAAALQAGVKNALADIFG